MTNKISRLLKRMTEEPFPTDGSLYDLGDGNLYQTEDGYTFHAVGDVSLLQNGCTNGTCRTTLKASQTTTNTKTIKTVSNEIFADIVGYSLIKREFVKAFESASAVGILLVGPPRMPWFIPVRTLTSGTCLWNNFFLWSDIGVSSKTSIQRWFLLEGLS